MKLELATFPVKDVRFSEQTKYNNGILDINKKELIALILEDKRVASADIDMAFPEEQTRIVKVRDVVEPRVKVSGPGCVFPGILGPIETVGEGRTHRLSGITVMPSAEYRRTILGGTAAGHAGMVDMWGPGAQRTPFATTINIVPIFELVDGVTELEAHEAIQLAEFKVARRLAESTRDMSPEDVEVFELFEVDPALPKVLFILTCMTQWHEPHSDVAYYGLSIRESFPFFMHPNELLDGALTQDARRGAGIRATTRGWMSSPILMELYREHGKQLNFLGVIVQRTRFETEFGKQITATCTAQMTKLLKADGIITNVLSCSGNNYMDVMLTIQACEKKGVKTVLVTPEWGGKDGSEVPLIFQVPEATAIISTGSLDRDIPLPAPTKVIGTREGEMIQIYIGEMRFSPWDEVTLPTPYYFTGGADWLGEMNLTCKEYR